jgi:hypothetical protein
LNRKSITALDASAKRTFSFLVSMRSLRVTLLVVVDEEVEEAILRE